MTKNDDEMVGRLLSRREVLRLLGAAGAAALVGCASGTSDSAQATGTAAGTAGAAGATPMPNTAVPTATAALAEAVPTATTLVETAPTATPVVEAAPTATAAPEALPTATTMAAVPSCIVRPAVTEGPYFVDERIERSDIRSDPATGDVKEGALLALMFNVTQLGSNSCSPFAGAVVDVWHCDALGVYSGVSDPGFDTSDQKFLRGYQVTDANGVARFTTIYPGWYSGRAVHIHFKVRTDPAAEQGYEFTSQLFFDDAFSNQVFTQEPYASKGPQNTLNSTDNIYRDQLLVAVNQTNEGYAATFDIGLDLSADT